MRLRTLFFILLILALPALACNFVNQLLEPAPTFEPPPTDPGMQPSSDDTAVPLPTPIGGDAGHVTATASAGDAPTATSPDELGVPPNDPVALADWLIQAYRAQEDVVSLCNVLHASAWMADGATCETADLDGVTPDEWLLALYLEPTPDSVGDDSLQGPPGDFWIVGQSGIVYQMHGLDTSDVFGRLPELVSLLDMTGDEQDDAILLYVTCGAHTCFNNYQIVSAEGAVLRNIVDAGDESESVTPELFDFISMAHVEEEQVRDVTDDELEDLVISGGLIGSAGAGIQRPFTEVWAWDGSAITLAERHWEDTGYRFHRLYNANAAFEDETYDEARALYESVVVDPGLEEVDFTYPVEEVRAYTRQFAGFRLALLPLLRGDITEATRWQNWLSQEYSGSALSEATAILIQTWDQNGNNLPSSCDQVTNYLANQEAPTGPLEDMGYANPSLTAADVCPF